MTHAAGTTSVASGPEVASSAPRPGQSKKATRTKARKRAVDILFEAELRGVDPLSTLTVRTEDADPPVREFTTELVRGVCENRPEIDRRIIGHLASGWTLPRIPRVDRAVLRMAVFELGWTEVPPPVAVAEAVALVQDLSTDDSPKFVNGVLGSIVDTPVGPGQGEVSQ